MKKIKVFPSLREELKSLREEFKSVNVNTGGAWSIIVTQCPICLRTMLCSGDELVSNKHYCNGVTFVHFDNIADADFWHFNYYNNFEADTIHFPRLAIRKRIKTLKELN